MREIERKFGKILLLETQVHEDERGKFFESYNSTAFEQISGEQVEFFQDNCSVSKKRVIRGMHYQVVRPQSKLVRVLSGKVYDVVVDLRKNSPSFGQWAGFELSSENARALWIPAGFAHGFMSLANNVILSYKVTAPWHKEHDRSLLWNDPDIGIEWPTSPTGYIVSQKDRDAARFSRCEYFAE